MLLVFRLALRNLQRHFRRSLITILSIGFGLAVILWLQAILAGSNKNVIDTIASTYHGHMQIFRADYNRDRLIHQTFAPESLPLGTIARGRFEWTPRLLLPSLISSGEQSFPVLLEGIDPDREVQITRVRESLVEGSFLTKDDAKDCSTRSAYMSRALAKLLDVNVGNKVVILAQARDGSMGNELLRVKGLFDTGSPEYDKSVVFTSIPCVSTIGALSGAHEIAIHINNQDDAPGVKADIRKILTPDLTVMTWQESQPQLSGVIKFNDASIVLVSIMLFTVISLGILNTFLVTVFERTTEFGVMMALGASPRRIVALVLTESLVLGIAASVLGIAVGALIITYHYSVGFDLKPLVGENLSVGAYQLKLIIFPLISWLDSAKATIITLLVVMISAIYPAFRASRLKPIEAIRSV